MGHGFASDNATGAHPSVLDALARANGLGHLPSYGDDALTRDVTERLVALFGGRGAAFLVFNGTAANVLALAPLLRPHEAVICAETAHMHVDECGAAERFLGAKLLTVATPDGKLTPALAASHLKGVGFVHHVQPRVVSLTNATELGTVYRPDEVRAMCEWAHANRLLVHVDGARLANAAAALDVPLAAITTEAGVDVVSFGGTKNGLMGAEAVVFRDAKLAESFPYARKQGMQLASKMRFLAAQFDAYLTDDRWLALARHANAMARLLAAEAARVPGVRLARPAEANEVFAFMPAEAVQKAMAEVPFYEWDEATHEVRWVCAWDTTEEDVRALVAALRRATA